MLDIIELERTLLDACVNQVPSLNNDNVILMPYNSAEPPAPYMGIQTLELPHVCREIEGDVDPATGLRPVTQHYQWRVRFRAIGQNDPVTKALTVSATALIQELALYLSTEVMRDELRASHISMLRVGAPRRSPVLKDNEYEDQAYIDVKFGVADQIDEFISFVETLEDTQGSYKRHPDDPDPIITP